MIKKTLFPKIKRYGKDLENQITEKLDGSNLGIFNINGTLLIAQRNYIFEYKQINNENVKKILYKGLYEWLNEFGKKILGDLNENSGIFGERLGMCSPEYMKYFDNKFYIFAKAKISTEFKTSDLNLNVELIKYAFKNKEIPGYLNVVPLIKNLKGEINLEKLNDLYEEYKKDKERKVEGFIIYDGKNIQKYIRHKGKKIVEHTF